MEADGLCLAKTAEVKNSYAVSFVESLGVKLRIAFNSSYRLFILSDRISRGGTSFALRSIRFSSEKKPEILFQQPARIK